MGIASLLPNLKSITRKAHVSQYAGQTAAVDAYCLLHRGAHACARELVEGEPTDRSVALQPSGLHAACLLRVPPVPSAPRYPPG